MRAHGAAEVRQAAEEGDHARAVRDSPQRYRIFVLVAIESGVRWGELAALRPVDVDLETGEIHDRRVVGEVTKKITGADKV